MNHNKRTLLAVVSTATLALLALGHGHQRRYDSGSAGGFDGLTNGFAAKM